MSFIPRFDIADCLIPLRVEHGFSEEMETEAPGTVFCGFIDDFCEGFPLHMVFDLLPGAVVATKVARRRGLNKDVSWEFSVNPSLSEELVQERWEFFCELGIWSQSILPFLELKHANKINIP